jgi:UDP-N-acetylmuramoylalanine-D-glutamate ligase
VKLSLRKQYYGAECASLDGAGKQFLLATSQMQPARILVTGTNGKTTISRLVAELLMLQGSHVR